MPDGQTAAARAPAAHRAEQDRRARRRASSPSFVRPDLEARGYRVFEISTVEPRGPAPAVVRARRASSSRHRRRAAPPSRRARAIVIRPEAVDEAASSSRSRAAPTARATGSSARSRSAGSRRPTSRTTRPSATSPTGSPSSASRTSCSRPARSPGSTVVIGRGDGVVFDWEPTLTSTAELITAPRGTRRRASTRDRPAAPRDQRRERLPRADGRQGRRPAPNGPRDASGLGSDDDCDRDAADEDVRMTIDDRCRGPDAARGSSSRSGSSSISGENAGQIGPLVDALAAAHAPRHRGRARLLRRDRHRHAVPAARTRGRPTSRRSRPRPRSARTCSSTATRTASTGYGIVAGQVLLTAGDLENPTHRSNARARDGAAARRCASCRSSTRTTPSRPTRSASATTTGSPRSWRSWSAPTCWSCSPTSTRSTRGRRRSPAREPIDVRRLRRRPATGVEIGSAGVTGVGTGGAATKVVRRAAGGRQPESPCSLTATDARRARPRAATTVGTWFAPARRRRRRPPDWTPRGLTDHTRGP